MLYTEDLDGMVCSNPECEDEHDDLYLHAACHISSYMEVCYEKETGSILVACGTCKKPAGTIKVATKESK